MRIDSDDRVELVSKAENMEFFGSLRDSGAEPLSDYARFHYADNNGTRGFVVLTRRMDRGGVDQEFLFNVHWEKIDGEWKIVRETVFLK